MFPSDMPMELDQIHLMMKMLWKKNQIPWLLSMGSCQFFSYHIVVEVSAESMIIVMVIESSLCFTLIISLKHLCDIHTINDLRRNTDLHPEELDLHPVSDEETGTLEVKPHARSWQAVSCVLNQIPYSSPRYAREPPPRWGWSGPWPLQADVGTESWHAPPASRLRPVAP